MLTDMLSFVSGEVTLCTAVTDAGFCEVSVEVTVFFFLVVEAVSEVVFVVFIVFAVFTALTASV